ncbi:hypothetical protein CN070_23920 [Sinorhizobium meliloti]|nr:hypothetical protein CN070_23920 [Sinorhizobium meliloti]
MAKVRCSSGRDAVIHLAGAYSPCSIQGNRFERRLHIFYSQQGQNQGKAPDWSALTLNVSSD